MKVARTHWESLLGETQSPIERDFLVAFCDVAVEHGYGVAKRAGDAIIGVAPQKSVGPFFLDFGISFSFFGFVLDIAVEADGHAFHEKTPGQARRDRTRERLIAALGYRVLRFTGSEINGDAKRCAMEVLSQIMDFQTASLQKSASKIVGGIR